MIKPESARYHLSDDDALLLTALAISPRDMRLDILATKTPYQVVALFVEFMGLANSVEINAREVAEYVLRDQGKLAPEVAKRINLPTVMGALMGVGLANGAGQARGTCKGCAYRHATPANQSHVTTGYALAAERGEFLCHERPEGGGDPDRICRGHARANRFADIEAKR